MGVQRAVLGPRCPAGAQRARRGAGGLRVYWRSTLLPDVDAARASLRLAPRHSRAGRAPARGTDHRAQAQRPAGVERRELGVAAALWAALGQALPLQGYYTRVPIGLPRARRGTNRKLLIDRRPSGTFARLVRTVEEFAGILEVRPAGFESATLSELFSFCGVALYR